METWLLFGKGYLNKIHLNSAYTVSVVLNVGYDADMVEIVWLHSVPINF